MREHARVHSRNDLYQRLEAVKRSRGKRKEYGECFVESVAAIDAAVLRGWEIRLLAHAADRKLSHWARALIGRCPAAMIVEMDQELLADLSDREETSEVVAIVGIRRPGTGVIPLRMPFAALLLDRPSSPGNLGSILRSCDSFGASGVVIRGHGADLYDPQTIRSSLGAVFSVPTAAECSNSEIEAWFGALRAALPGLQVVGSSPSAEVCLYDADLTAPTVLVLGNERTGMSEWLRSAVDRTVAVPSLGTVDSLNLASAATVLLYELTRQRAVGRPRYSAPSSTRIRQ